MRCALFPLISFFLIYFQSIKLVSTTNFNGIDCSWSESFVAANLSYSAFSLSILLVLWSFDFFVLLFSILFLDLAISFTRIGITFLMEEKRKENVALTLSVNWSNVKYYSGKWIQRFGSTVMSFVVEILLNSLFNDYDKY